VKKKARTLAFVLHCYIPALDQAVGIHHRTATAYTTYNIQY